MLGGIALFWADWEAASSVSAPYVYSKNRFSWSYRF